MTAQRQLEYVVEPGQEYEFDLFRPEDAEGVVKLFLSIYGEGYPIKTFIDPDKLIEENAAGRTVSSVARTLKGDIVGHNALFQSSPNPKIAESGAGGVHAAYRGGAGIFTGMVRHGVEVAARAYQKEAIHTEPVCNHVFSQKLTRRLGCRTTTLEVDLMPAAAYVKEGSARGRVSNLIDFLTLVPFPHTVYLPEQYEEPMREIYGRLDDARTLAESADPIPVSLTTDITPQVFDFARVARLTIREAGSDFADAMDGLEKELRARNVTVIQAWLNLAWPWVGEAVEVLRRKGYFFGGVLPRWYGTDGMLMQKIAGRPSWEGIVIEFEEGARMVEIVKRDWERTMNG